jgi:hypothetical protein
MEPTGCTATIPLPGHRTMAQVIADEQSRYDIRKGSRKANQANMWYVRRTGTRVRLSMFFDTYEKADSCRKVLIQDDRQRT